MRVLVACEESQAVCIAFRELGHEAYSCDVQPCSGGHPEWHIQDDVLAHVGDGWDMMIAFPPCTYLTYAGIAHWNNEGREQLRNEASAFFLQLWNVKIPKVCIENPVGHMNTIWRKPTQIIQPYYFGDPHVKRTCLWLRGLPKLNGSIYAALRRDRNKPAPLSVQFRRPGKHYKGGEVKNRYFVDVKSSKSGKERSKTFPGIARAMAEQWGGLVKEKVTI